MARAKYPRRKNQSQRARQASEREWRTLACSQEKRSCANQFSGSPTRIGNEKGITEIRSRIGLSRGMFLHHLRGRSRSGPVHPYSGVSGGEVGPGRRRGATEEDPLRPGRDGRQISPF